MTTNQLPGFDPGSPQFRADPYPSYARLRQETPVLRHPAGFWVLTRYRDCALVLRDERWGRRDQDDTVADSARLASMSVRVLPNTAAGRPVQPFMRMNPPEHTRLRRLVGTCFTPDQIDALAPRVQQIVDELLDAALADADVDLMERVAVPLPLRVICERLGVAHDDWPTIRTWSDDFSRGFDPDFTLTAELRERSQQAAVAMREYCAELIAQRRRRPGTDLVSQLMAIRDGDDALSEEELVVNTALLLVAGNDTTINFLGNSMYALLRQPAAAAHLRDHPEIAESAMEELLRYDAPFQFGDRVALTDVALGEQQIHRGDFVLVVVGSANRDPEVFPDPDRLDLTRTPNPHLTFGRGAHFCIGARLAKLQGRLALTALLRRAPRMELAGEPTRKPNFVNLGLATLPARLG